MYPKEFNCLLFLFAISIMTTHSQNSEAIDFPPRGIGPSKVFPGPEPGDLFREYRYRNGGGLRVGGKLDYGGNKHKRYIQWAEKVDQRKRYELKLLLKKV